MRHLKQIILPLLLLLACTVSGGAQVKDTISVDLPVIDYRVPKKYLLKDIKITGSNHIPSQLIINTAGLTKGDSIYLPSDYITNAIQVLWGQRYYADIQAAVEIEDEDVYLELILKERPRVSLWEINGATKAEKKELDERLDFKHRSEMSDYALNNSKDIINRFYSEKGYLNSEVKIRQRNDSLIDNYVIVSFDINKNNKMKIKEINIEGNVELAENKLKNSMSKTREKTLFNIMKSAKYSKKEFNEVSKGELVDYIHSKGFRDGAVLSDSLYVINDKRIGLNIKINEGDKYYYRDISWVGNTKYNSEVLEQILGIKRGDTYDRKTMESRLGTDGQSAMEGALTVSSLYQNDGHLAFTIEPVETVIEGDSIDIEMRMSEGGQFTINEVVISGNDRTHDRVVRRDLYIRPGELYDQSMLINSIRQIGAMEHFNAEKAVPDIQPVSDELVDIRFNLEEKASDQFEFSGGWGSGMFVVSASVAFNNLSLRRIKEEGAWNPYPAGDNQQLKLSVQSNGTYYQAYSFSFLEPWLGGKKPISLSASAYYSAQNSSYSYYYTTTDDDSKFRTVGVSATIGKRLSWPDPYFQVMGELSYQAYLLSNWSSFLITDGTCNTIAFAGTLMRSSLDQSIFPRRGSEVMFKLKATPPWSLMNKSIDWEDEDLDDETRYKWIEYYKINTSAKFFLPMTKSGNLVLMTKAEFGYLGSYNENNPSPFEGFSVGGDGVSGYTLYGVDDIGLRGYDDGALTPYADYGQQARVYSKWTAELRYPVIMEGSTNVYVLVFAEAGNAATTWKSFQPFNLKRSLGAGVRLYLPIVGLFGIDWGYGFDKTPNSTEVSGSQFHFSMGQTF